MSAPVDIPVGTPADTDRGAGRGEVVAAGVALAVSSALACVLAVAWLTQRVDGVAVPVTIPLAALWSLVLVRLAGRWSSTAAFRAIPVVAWLVTLVLLDLGPGGDLPVPPGLRGLCLVVAGVVVPLWAVLLNPARRGGGPRSR